MIKINNILDVEKYADEYKAIVFDLDDTLYSEKDYVISGFKAIQDNFPQYNNLFEDLWNAFENKEPAIDNVFNSKNLVSEINTAINIYRNHKCVVKPYDGVVDMLKRLEEKEKVLGIITDGRPVGQHNKLKALNLNISNVIITDELGGEDFRKPNDAAFIRMQKMIDVDFSKIVYVGDNIHKDFIAPESLGMGSIYFQNKEGLYNN